MIEGFCGLDDRHEFFLSPRNEVKSAMLANKYANVNVCGSNQGVVDESEIVFISMNAASCPEALNELRFTGGEMVINLVATIPPEDIRAAIGPVRSFYHVVPLPFISRRVGPIAAYPESAELRKLLEPMGTVVFAGNMEEIRIMQAITALMSSFYEMLHHLTVFAETEGLGREAAISFTSTFFGALCQRAESFRGGDLHTLALEMTPGGLNEYCLKTLTESRVIKAWADILPSVMMKIKPE